MKLIKPWIFVLLLFPFLGKVALAHESQPALLELKQVTKQNYEVSWRAPIYFGQPHPARLALPIEWQILAPQSERQLSDSQLFAQIVSIPKEGLEGSVINFPGLENTVTDVFVRVIGLDGNIFTAVVRPSNPVLQLRGDRLWASLAWEYLLLGFYHILQGIDHLLFVLGLLLLVGSRLMLIKTITAFTLAHSITLAIATLGFAHAPLLPLNAAIALSIFFLGPEIIRAQRGQSSLTLSYPWLVAFLFGLLHGFGFASGLSTTGMGQSEIPFALLFFNVGVELGQLLFVFTALWLKRSFEVLQINWPRWVQALPAYTVGSLGAYWTIQRTVILLGGI